jgi:hypothetical protein
MGFPLSQALASAHSRCSMTSSRPAADRVELVLAIREVQHTLPHRRRRLEAAAYVNAPSRGRFAQGADQAS